MRLKLIPSKIFDPRTQFIQRNQKELRNVITYANYNELGLNTTVQYVPTRFFFMSHSAPAVGILNK